VKALKPLVAGLDQPVGAAEAPASAAGMLLRFARVLKSRRDPK
jgi:hypothetical protein